MSNNDCSLEFESVDQARVLWWLLGINAAMFIVEIVAGVMAQSAALMADSLDMLADATVYAIALYAVGRTMKAKIRAALLSGIFQIALALGVAIETLRRAVWGSEPEALFMIGVSAIALMANVICCALISKFREGEVHMRASWIFSKNDVIANTGVILAGGLVYLLDSRMPDLVIGAIIMVVIFKGGISIIADARDGAKPPIG